MTGVSGVLQDVSNIAFLTAKCIKKAQSAQSAQSLNLYYQIFATFV
jgi:hypothetical protein